MTIPLFNKSVACLFWFLLLFLANNSSAQEFRHDAYNLSACAPNLSLQSIHQDTGGNMLLHTTTGLYKYDGLTYHFIAGSNTIRKIIELPGKRFFATQQSGVFEMFPQADTIIFKLFSDCTVPVQVYADQEAHTWIATETGKIFRIKGAERIKYQLAQSLRNCFFTEINGLLWIITDQGQWYWFSAATHQFINVASPIGQASICAVLKRNEQTLWVATSAGVQAVRVDFQSLRFEKNITTAPDVNCLLDDGQTDIYLGTLHHGLFRIPKEDDTNTLHPVYFANTVQNIEKLPFVSVYDLCMDKDRGIWVSNELGMSHLHAKIFLTFYNKSPLDDWTFIVQAANEEYYFTRWGMSGTLFRFKPGLTDIDAIPVWNTGSAYILTITSDRDDVWASNSQGKIYHVRNNKPAGTLDLSKRGGAIFQLFADSKHRLWFSQAPSKHSLPGTSYTDQSLQVHYYGENAGLQNRIICFNESAAKQLYFGGVGGKTYLYTFDENNQSFINLSVPLPFDASSLEVHDIVIDADGSIWLATTHGLLKYTPQTKSIEQIQLGEHALSHSEMRSLAIDQYQQLWIGTDVYGVLCYNIKSSQVTTYGLADGVPSKNIFFRSVYIDRTERLWVVTDAGLIFSKDRALRVIPTRLPKLYYFKVNGEVVNHRTADELKVPNQARLDIGFHSLSYPSVGLTYQWRVKGLEEEWSEESGENHINIPDLMHGAYTIEIRARQLGYGWSEPLAIPVYVQQVWYLQWWAFLLYAVGALLLLIGVSHLHSLRLYRKNIDLQDKVDSKTQELRGKNREISAQNLELIQQNSHISQQAKNLEALNILKNRLFSIISHDLRGPLGAVKGVLALVSTDALSDQEFKTIAPELVKELDNTSMLLDNMLHWAKSQMEGVVLHRQIHSVFAVVEQQMALFTLLSKNKGVTLINTVPQSTIAIMDVQMTGIILRNLIANAIKFCRAGDTVTIRADASEQELCIVVADTGIGISAENQAKLFQPISYTTRGTAGEYGTGLGLLVCKEYVEKMGGTIAVESAAGTGTAFYCRIPQVAEP